MKKNIPIIREREGNEKKTFPKFVNGKVMKKSILIFRERESEAFISGNGRERNSIKEQEFNKKQGNRDTSFINCFHSIAPFKYDVFILIHSANKDFDFFRLITSL